VAPLRGWIGQRPSGWPPPHDRHVAWSIRESADLLDGFAKLWRWGVFVAPEPERLRTIEAMKREFSEECERELCRLALLLEKVVGWENLRGVAVQWAEKGKSRGYA